LAALIRPSSFDPVYCAGLCAEQVGAVLCLDASHAMDAIGITSWSCADWSTPASSTSMACTIHLPKSHIPGFRLHFLTPGTFQDVYQFVNHLALLVFVATGEGMMDTMPM